MGPLGIRFSGALVRSATKLSTLEKKPLGSPFINPDTKLGQAATYGQFRADPQNHLEVVAKALRNTPLPRIHAWKLATTPRGHVDAALHFQSLAPTNPQELSAHISYGLRLMGDTVTTLPSRLAHLSAHLNDLRADLDREARLTAVVSGRAAQVAGK